MSILGVLLGRGPSRSLVLVFATVTGALLACASSARGEDSKEREPTAEERASIERFFDTLREAFASDDEEKLEASIDAPRMLRVAMAVAGREDPGDVASLGAAALRRTLAEAFRESSDFFEWERHVIRRVRIGPEPDSAIVVVAHVDADNFYTKFRWWLVHEGDAWRFYDLEEVSTGLRSTGGMAAMLVAGNVDRARSLEVYPRIESATRDLLIGEVAAARATIDGLPDELPPLVDSLRWLVGGSIAAAQGRFRDTIEDLAKGRASGVRLPAASLLEAQALLALRRESDALARIQEYEEAVGSDPDSHLTAGIALRRLGRIEEALERFRMGLDEYADSTEILVELGRTLPEKELGELGSRFEKLTEPVEWFETLARGFLDARSGSALMQLVDAYRRMQPKDPNVAYYSAQAFLLAGRPSDAFEQVKSVLPRVRSRDDYAYYFDLYVESAAAAKRSLDAYGGVAEDERGGAFWRLVDLLIEREEVPALEALVAARREHAPDDPVIAYHAARALILRGESDEADRLLVAALAALDDGDEEKEYLREFLREARWASWAVQGKGAAAYEEIPPHDEAFDFLTDYYLEKEDPAELERLVNAHRERAPVHPLLPLLQSEVHWLRREYADVVAVLQRGDDPLVEFEDQLDWYEYNLIRSLIRLGRPAEALVAAKVSTARDGDPFWEVLVHASAGDVEALTAALATCVERFDYDLEDFTKDEDIGPALRKEPGAAVAERFARP